jgi:hypothetical protein
MLQGDLRSCLSQYSAACARYGAGDRGIPWAVERLTDVSLEFGFSALSVVAASFGSINIGGNAVFVTIKGWRFCAGETRVCWLPIVVVAAQGVAHADIEPQDDGRDDYPRDVCQQVRRPWPGRPLVRQRVPVRHLESVLTLTLSHVDGRRRRGACLHSLSRLTAAGPDPHETCLCHHIPIRTSPGIVHIAGTGNARMSAA